MKRILQKFSGLSSRTQNEEIDEELEDLNEEIDEESIDESDNNENQAESEWLEEDFEEGQLSIDVYQDPKSLIIKSTIAGVKPEDIDISIADDGKTTVFNQELNETLKKTKRLWPHKTKTQGFFIAKLVKS